MRFEGFISVFGILVTLAMNDRCAFRQQEVFELLAFTGIQTGNPDLLPSR